MERSQYEQQWPLPMAVNRELPKPWFVAAYAGSALGNVLRSDYGATYRDGVFIVDGGEMKRVYRSNELHGAKGGTLFVLYGHGGSDLDRILEVAHHRGLHIADLETRPV